jgi:hypothetical protein
MPLVMTHLPQVYFQNRFHPTDHENKTPGLGEYLVNSFGICVTAHEQSFVIETVWGQTLL